MTLHRVLIATGIYPPDIGGPATFARILVEEFPRHDIEPILLTFSRLMRYPRGVRHGLFFWEVLARGRRADVLLALDPVSVGLPTLLAARLLRKPFILRLGGDFAWEQAVERFAIDPDPVEFETLRQGLRVTLLRKAQRLTATRAARVIVPDRSMHKVAERWGVTPTNIVELPNVVALPDLPSSPEAARTQLGIEGRVIVSMGRLILLKGFEGLIDAVAALRVDVPNVRLVIIGSGPQYPSLAEKVRSMGLTGTVSLTGPLAREKSLLYVKAAELFVLNSACEGQANSILEAMALGTPVIATRAGGTVDLIQHGRNGWLVGYNHRAELTEAMRALLHDPARAARLAASARLPPERLDKSRMVRSLTELLQSVA